jgi:hypothetical protein
MLAGHALGMTSELDSDSATVVAYEVGHSGEPPLMQFGSPLAIGKTRPA